MTLAADTEVVITAAEYDALRDTCAAYERYDVWQGLAAENVRLRAGLEAFANPQHWAVSRRFTTPEHVWIGTVVAHPTEVAREALAVPE